MGVRGVGAPNSTRHRYSLNEVRVQVKVLALTASWIVLLPFSASCPDAPGRRATALVRRHQLVDRPRPHGGAPSIVVDAHRRRSGPPRRRTAGRSSSGACTCRPRGGRRRSARRGPRRRAAGASRRQEAGAWPPGAARGPPSPPTERLAVHGLAVAQPGRAGRGPHGVDVEQDEHLALALAPDELSVEQQRLPAAQRAHSPSARRTPARSWSAVCPFADVSHALRPSSRKQGTAPESSRSNRPAPCPPSMGPAAGPGRPAPSGRPRWAARRGAGFWAACHRTHPLNLRSTLAPTPRMDMDSIKEAAAAPTSAASRSQSPSCCCSSRHVAQDPRTRRRRGTSRGPARRRGHLGRPAARSAPARSSAAASPGAAMAPRARSNLLQDWEGEETGAPTTMASAHVGVGGTPPTPSFCRHRGSGLD